MRDETAAGPYARVLLHIDDQPRRLRDGEVIFSSGDVAAEMYIVKEGTVQLLKDMVPIERLEVGAIFGEMALIDRSPRCASAVAIGAGALTVIDQAVFDRLLTDMPGFARELLQLVARRLRNA